MFPDPGRALLVGISGSVKDHLTVLNRFNSPGPAGRAPLDHTSALPERRTLGVGFAAVTVETRSQRSDKASADAFSRSSSSDLQQVPEGQQDAGALRRNANANDPIR